MLEKPVRKIGRVFASENRNVPKTKCIDQSYVSFWSVFPVYNLFNFVCSVISNVDQSNIKKFVLPKGAFTFLSSDHTKESIKVNTTRLCYL